MSNETPSVFNLTFEQLEQAADETQTASIVELKHLFPSLLLQESDVSETEIVDRLRRVNTERFESDEERVTQIICAALVTQYEIIYEQQLSTTAAIIPLLLWHFNPSPDIDERPSFILDTAEQNRAPFLELAVFNSLVGRRNGLQSTGMLRGIAHKIRKDLR